MTIIINNLDLPKKQYDEIVLINNINHLSLKQIIITQKKLSLDFINKYILFPSHEQIITVEESYIDNNDVIKYQPHLVDLI
jgi:hypothetical protein